MTFEAVSPGFALSFRSALHTRAWTRMRSPTTRSVIFFLPWRRTFVSGLTAIDVDAVPATYARPQRFALLTSTLRGVPVSVPFSTTMTFGLQPAPAAGGLPLPSGGAATADDTTRPATANPASATLIFIDCSFTRRRLTVHPHRCGYPPKLAPT